MVRLVVTLLSSQHGFLRDEVLDIDAEPFGNAWMYLAPTSWLPTILLIKRF